MLDVWPALPLNIMFKGGRTRIFDNIIAALERRDRVRQISLIDIRSLELEILLAAMQQPFPGLTYLYLWSSNKTVAVVPDVPDSFLGGSAPRLHYLELGRIPFPGLPKLLLSATHLVTLRLWNIFYHGYFSPDGMAATLSTLTSLEHLWLSFDSPLSRPDPATRRPPPSTRSVLPVLTSFWFCGVSEYLEDLVACIDAPQLNKLEIIFFNDSVFDTPQLVRFIINSPKSKALENTYIILGYDAARVEFSSQTSPYGKFTVKILCDGLYWQVSSLEKVFASCLPPLSILEDLYFCEESAGLQPDWKDSIENRKWLELLRPFMAVKNLYLSEIYVSHIAPALQELVEGRTTDVLPALQNIFLDGFDSSRSVQESIGQLVAARQVTNHPVGISPWTDLKEGMDWSD